jgi:hypothetical protein
MLWVNGDDRAMPRDGHAFYRAHPFNVGQHVAHNEMLDECVRLGVSWHIRADDDCFISTRTWLKRLLAVQDEIKALRGKYAVLGINVEGLDNPPPNLQGYELKRETIETVDILGGVFRMAPMSLMRYFRWDERQAMGFGDATQFRSFCQSTATDMYRVRGIRATHGESTKKQQQDRTWDYEHDMLQYIPLGL